MSELRFKDSVDYALSKTEIREKKLNKNILEELGNDLFNFCAEDFEAGAKWYINSIWHDINDRSITMKNDEDIMLLLENGKIVDYDDDWEEYYCQVLKWAYKKDLIPNVKK